MRVGHGAPYDAESLTQQRNDRRYGATACEYTNGSRHRLNRQRLSRVVMGGYHRGQENFAFTANHTGASYGRANGDRMDRCDVESDDGLHTDHNRV